MGARTGWLVGGAVAAPGVFALMLIGYLAHWAWLGAADTAMLSATHRIGVAHPAWVVAWDVFCTVLGPTAFRLVTLGVIVVALVRRRVRTALFLAVSVELAGLLTEAVKAMVDRPRPATALVHAPSSSFPSGHALGVMVAVCALLVVARPAVSATRRGWLVAAGVLLVVAIGFGRIMLNVHHPSDVVAGWALGFAYFVACLLAFRPVTRPDGTPAAPGTRH